jgi:hypothetical protein
VHREAWGLKLQVCGQQLELLEEQRSTGRLRHGLSFDQRVLSTKVLSDNESEATNDSRYEHERTRMLSFCC